MLKRVRDTLQQRLGDGAEQVARRYLENHRLSCVEQNFRCKLGEIDLIMRDDAVLVFAEVRYRKQSGYADAAETVTRSKQRKLIRAAQAYLQHRPHTGPCRFDVVALTGPSPATADINWIQHAFEAV